MSKMQRTKGAAAEREVVGIFRDAGYRDAKRTSDGRAQVGRGDIAGGPVGFHIECKRHERLNVPAAFDQVREDADPDEVPLLIHRPSRHVWMCTVPLDQMLQLLKEAGR